MTSLNRKSAAAVILLLLSAGCTPNKVIKRGAVVDQARAVALNFCAAAQTEAVNDEEELFSAELQSILARARAGDLPDRLRLTSVDPRPLCRPGRVRGFGYHPEHLDISIEVELRGGTDRLFLSKSEPGRIEDIVYDRRGLGERDAWSFKSMLRELIFARERRQRATGG